MPKTIPLLNRRRRKRRDSRSTSTLNLGSLVCLVVLAGQAAQASSSSGIGDSIQLDLNLDVSNVPTDQLTACQAYTQALDLIDRLALNKDDHLYMQRRGRVDGLKLWESGWDLASVKSVSSKILGFPTTILDFIITLDVFSSSSSTSSSSSSSSSSGSGSGSSAHSSNYLSSSEKKRLGIKENYLTPKEETAMAIRLKTLLQRATEGSGRDVSSQEGENEKEDVCRRDAWGARGLIGLLPPRGGTLDLQDAAESFRHMSEDTSDAASQYLLGFLYASGLKGVEQDQSRALLYYTFAAIQGLPEAEMTLGFRYWMGIGVKEDCMRALDWYESVAHKAYANFISGPPGGKALPLNPTRLSDLGGGVYGMGASVASTGQLAKRPAIKAANSLAGGENFDDVLQYYQYHSDRNHHEYSVILGRIHYVGSVYSVPGGVASGAEAVGETVQSFKLATYYFTRAAHAYWGPEVPKLDAKTNGLPIGFDASWNKRKLTDEEAHVLRQPAGIAAAYLGRMYLRGEGVEQDFVLARMWSKRSSDLGEKEGHNLLGIMYRDGLGVPVNVGSAKAYFQAAAQMDLAEAKVHLGKFAANSNNQVEGEPKSMAHYTWALGNGNPFEAFYHLGLIHAKAARHENPALAKKTGTCGVAVSYLKSMVERGSWDYDMMGEADAAWKRGERTTALIRWWIAGEMGYEIAQNNVAFLLDQVGSRSNSKSSKLSRSVHTMSVADKANIAQDPALSALVHWIRSAGQQNVDSLVKVGDSYYQGIGISDGENRYEKAAGSYQSAADTQASAVAFWNLGWMYENGLGVAQDWHLAKRYYDLCAQTDPEAEWPVMLSLIKLYLRSWWTQLMGGKQKHLALFGMRKPSIGDDLPGATSPRANEQPSIEDEMDEVTWARSRQRDELEDSYDDYLETGRTARRNSRPDGGSDALGDGDLLETISIALLVIGFSTLMWWRGRVARQREEREQAERRARGQGPPDAERRANPNAPLGFVPAVPVPI